MITKKLWERHKEKNIKTQLVEQHNMSDNDQHTEDLKTSDRTMSTNLVTEEKENNANRRLLTQEEAIQELFKIIVGMSEVIDGKKKVSEGIENLSQTGIVDRETLLERLSDPGLLERLNEYLENNQQLLIQNQTILGGIFGRNLIKDGEYIPLTTSEIKRQQKIINIQEDNKEDGRQ